LVDLIFGPFLHLSALKLRNTKEWRDTMKKVKELEKKANDLQDKANKSYEQYQQMLADKAAKRNQNTKSYFHHSFRHRLCIYLCWFKRLLSMGTNARTNHIHLDVFRNIHCFWRHHMLCYF
jgi:hypothetical protein